MMYYNAHKPIQNRPKCLFDIHGTQPNESNVKLYMFTDFLPFAPIPILILYGPQREKMYLRALFLVLEKQKYFECMMFLESDSL